MKVSPLAFAGLLALAASAPVAFADDDRRGRDYRISHYDAMDIAQSFGLGWLKEMKRGNGNWEIEGCTGDGRFIEIDISGWSGQIIKLEYKEDDKC